MKSADKNPWLSVVMPVHNGAAYLADALESVAEESQDIEGVEIIILDSTDDDSCETIVGQFEGRCTIRYIRRTDILPWQAKTNEGVRLARADYVAMLHQDDRWLPGRATAVRRSVIANPAAVMHVTPSLIIDARGKTLGVWRCAFEHEGRWSGAAVLERLIIQNTIATPAPVFRRDAWLRAGGMDESLWYTADWDIYLKLIGQGELVYSSTPTTAYRIHGQSLTTAGSRNLVDFEQQMKVVADRYAGGIVSSDKWRTIRLAQLSIRINVALAKAVTGTPSAVVPALLSMLLSRPSEIARYLKYSRITDRIIPRIRAKVSGNI